MKKYTLLSMLLLFPAAIAFANPTANVGDGGASLPNIIKIQAIEKVNQSQKMMKQSL